MKSIVRNSLILLVLAAIAGVVVWGFVAGHADGDDDDDAPVQAPSRAMQSNGQTVLNFDAQAQHVNGIVVSVLSGARRSAAISAAATVLDLQPLLDIKAKYEAAQTTLAQVRAASLASGAEYKRLVALNRGGDNVSQKSIEAAQASSTSDAAALQNAQQSLNMLEDSTRLHWGPIVADWIRKGSPEFDALLAQKAYLLQITASDMRRAPADAILELPDGSHVSAHRIAVLPQVDPRLQASAYLYSLSARSGIAPGLNLPVSLPAGPLRNGVIIPQNAVVWALGQPWIYVEVAAGKFARRQIATSNPAPGGWFVTNGVAAGARVVTGGAQTMLSEEFRNQIQTDED